MEQTRHLEEMPITGISIKEDYAIMRVNDLPTDGVFIGKLFQLIAEMNINLDTISQQLSEEGRVNFSFYCSEEQSDPDLREYGPLGQRVSDPPHARLHQALGHRRGHLHTQRHRVQGAQYAECQRDPLLYDHLPARSPSR